MLNDILKNYAVRRVDDDPSLKKYMISDGHSEYLEIYIYVNYDREVRFVHDNFPGQRKFFTTNIPYTSIEDFETDLRRMGIKIPPKKNT